MTRIRSCSSRFVSGVGFSYGCAEFALTMPPAVRPDLLDRLLGRDRPEVDRLWVTLEPGGGDGAGPGLRDALPDEHDRRDEGDREQHVEGAAGHVDPEVADRPRRAAGDPADQGNGNSEADRRRQEVLHDEPDDLGEMRHRRLARVVLPVGVGREAHRRVEREVGRHGGHAGRIEGQGRLQPLLEVEDEDRQQAEHEHRARVRAPALLAGRVGPRDAVHRPLHRSQHAGEGMRSALEDGRDVAPEKRGDGDDEQDEHAQGEQIGDGHRSELLRPEQRHEQVEADQEAEDPRDELDRDHDRTTSHNQTRAARATKAASRSARTARSLTGGPRRIARRSPRASPSRTASAGSPRRTGRGAASG